MKTGVGVALVGVAIGVWYLRRPTTPQVAAPTASASTASSPASAAPKPLEHVRILASADERRQFAERIATAQASRAGSRAAIRAPAAPSLPAVAPTLDPDDPDTTKKTIRGAMREVIPLISECYEKAIPTLHSNETKVVAKLTLTSDPDVGTLIDAHEVLDDAGKPLPAGFDDCLRDTMQNLALPPIEDGGAIEVHYPFVFRH